MWLLPIFLFLLVFWAMWIVSERFLVQPDSRAFAAFIATCVVTALGELARRSVMAIERDPTEKAREAWTHHAAPGGRAADSASEAVDSWLVLRGETAEAAPPADHADGSPKPQATVAEAAPQPDSAAAPGATTQ